MSASLLDPDFGLDDDLSAPLKNGSLSPGEYIDIDGDDDNSGFSNRPVGYFNSN